MLTVSRSTTDFQSLVRSLVPKVHLSTFPPAHLQKISRSRKYEESRCSKRRTDFLPGKSELHGTGSVSESRPYGRYS